MRIALPAWDEPGWTAGAVFSEMVVRSLRGMAGDAIDITVLCHGDMERWNGLARAVPAPTVHLADKAAYRFGLPWPDPVERWCVAHRVSALLLYNRLGAPRLPFRRVPWIPDFQHRHLPEYFSADELSERDKAHARMARLGDAVLCSSHAAGDDFARFHPRFAAKGRVARFPSLAAFTPPPPEVGIRPAHYGLPEKFALVANQYWAHKNHAAVIDAVALLSERGLAVPVAFTGLPGDYRDPVNRNVSALLQRIATRGLSGQVVPLGLVPRSHLADLMRQAAVVIQPSRFEGWSTVVQDARALGRPVLCSDLPVHREQAPDALGFFACDDPKALADHLERVWPGLRPGPDPEAERACLERERAFAAEHGRALLAICRGD